MTIPTVWYAKVNKDFELPNKYKLNFQNDEIADIQDSCLYGVGVSVL